MLLGFRILFVIRILTFDISYRVLRIYMLQTHKPQFQTILDQLKGELDKLRTSRATPKLVEDITIEVYGGSHMRLKELASITIPDARTIVIKPLDKNNIKNI